MTQITVPDVPTFKEYLVTSSSTGPFIVPFAFFDEDDVFATVTDTLGNETSLVHSTDFTFDSLDVPVGQEGNGYEGGDISLNVAIGADGDTTIRIFRSTVIDRLANYLSTGPFLVALLNDEQNKIVMMLQELENTVTEDSHIAQVEQNTIDIANQADLIADLTANDPGGSYALLTNLISQVNGRGASLIGIEDVAGDFTAIEVEGALIELKAALAAHAIVIASNLSNITDLWVVSATLNGTFSCTLAGFGTPPSPIPFSYSKNGNLVTITCEGTGYATSDNVGMTSDVCVPAALRPDSERYGLFNVRDNGGDAVGLIRLLTAGSFIFYPDQTTGSSFTASGSKGIGKCTFSYNLNNS